jgi:hypothetical protein
MESPLPGGKPKPGPLGLDSLLIQPELKMFTKSYAASPAGKYTLQGDQPCPLMERNRKGLTKYLLSLKSAMNLQPEDLFRIKRSDVVAESIKQFIVSQNLKPGDRLPP